MKDFKWRKVFTCNNLVKRYHAIILAYKSLHMCLFICICIFQEMQRQIPYGTAFDMHMYPFKCVVTKTIFKIIWSRCKRKMIHAECPASRNVFPNVSADTFCIKYFPSQWKKSIQSQACDCSITVECNCYRGSALEKNGDDKRYRKNFHFFSNSYTLCSYVDTVPNIRD